MRAGPAVLFLPSRFFGGWPEDSFFNDPWPCSSTLVPDESPISPSPPPFTSLLLRSPMGLTATLTENQLAPPTSEGIVPAEGVRDHPSFGGASLRLCVFAFLFPAMVYIVSQREIQVLCDGRRTLLGDSLTAPV